MLSVAIEKTIEKIDRLTGVQVIDFGNRPIDHLKWQALCLIHFSHFSLFKVYQITSPFYAGHDWFRLLNGAVYSALDVWQHVLNLQFVLLADVSSEIRRKRKKRAVTFMQKIPNTCAVWFHHQTDVDSCIYLSCWNLCSHRWWWRHQTDVNRWMTKELDTIVSRKRRHVSYDSRWDKAMLYYSAVAVREDYQRHSSALIKRY